MTSPSPSPETVAVIVSQTGIGPVAVTEILSAYLGMTRGHRTDVRDTPGIYTIENPAEHDALVRLTRIEDCLRHGDASGALELSMEYLEERSHLEDSPALFESVRRVATRQNAGIES